MAKKRVYTEQEKANTEDTMTVLQRVYAYAASGLSKRSIAAKLGVTLTQFTMLLLYKEHGIERYQMAYDAGRAVFEEENIAVLEEILETGSEGIKAKIARDNLKTLEEWAPATRAVKVQVEDSRTILEFEALTDEEQQSIIAKNTESDEEPDSE